VKLRSAARRLPRPRIGPGGTMMAADPEPQMRLSRALLVMLLMHIVVIGGIVAFSVIKERNPAQPAAQSAAVEAEDSQLATPGVATIHKADAGALRPNIHVVRQGETLTRIANESGVTLDALVAANSANNVTAGLHPGEELKLPNSRAPAATPKPSGAAADALALIEGPEAAAGDVSSGDAARKAHLPADSGKTYIVGKGETPISIAHKLKVSYDALLKLNGIDDPKKLKPGQKLRIPVSPKPAPVKH
jgi:LysM repeat protein